MWAKSWQLQFYCIDLPISVRILNTVAVIMFDTTVVAVTLARTQGTWRLYKPSTWRSAPPTNLLTQQSKSHRLSRPFSDTRKPNRSQKVWVSSGQYLWPISLILISGRFVLTITLASLITIMVLSLSPIRTNCLVFIKDPRLWEWVRCWWRLYSLSNFKISLLYHRVFYLYKTGRSPHFLNDVSFIWLMACSLSAIVICRFHLELQMRHAGWRSRTTSDCNLTTLPIADFHSTTQRMHNAVVAEFGDGNSDHDEILEEEEPPDTPAGTTGDDNDIARG